VEFREAMDELGLTAADVADALGVTPQTVRQMRMDPSAAGYRTPPEAWPAVLAKLARARGGEMQKLADRIERQSR
jgi:transcriptional regulator with XRE-family HTH domain